MKAGLGASLEKGHKASTATLKIASSVLPNNNPSRPNADQGTNYYRRVLASI